MTMPAPRPDQSIQAYFSHSYRADDRSVNLFFWRLFSQLGFFFTVDPKSGRTFVPHLERMLRNSDCFIAVVTRRLELVRAVGNVTLPQPQVVWTHSPYIHIENRLAYRSGKPRLIFVESGLDANLFGTPEEVRVFDRDILNKREHLYHSWVEEFAATVQDYKRYNERVFLPTRKAGIMIGSCQEDQVYTPETFDLLKESLRAGGYTPYTITPDMRDDQQFIRDLSDLDLLVSEVREPWVSPVAQAFSHARFLPTIRLCHLRPGESRENVTLPAFLDSYRAGDLDPVVTWRGHDELALDIVQHMQKFQQSRTLLDSLDAGRRYFLSAGRRRARVFVSNAHTLNDLALELIKGFQTVNIQFFHYQATLRIGSAWQAELKRELNECDLFIALVNDDYHASRWCQFELESAYDRWRRHEVTILPFVVNNSKPPEMIRDSIQCAFTANTSTNELVAQIVETVDKLLVQLEQAPAVNDTVSAFETALDRTSQTLPDAAAAEAFTDTVHALTTLVGMDYDVDEILQSGNDLSWTHVGLRNMFSDLPNFPDRVPMIIAGTPVLKHDAIETLKSWLIGQPTRIALLVAPTTGEPLQALRQALDHQIRRVHACDVVVLSHSDLKAIVRDPSPASALRAAVLSQVNILNYAPFIVNGSTPDHMFFGREAELRTICENVRVASYAVIGGRRIGKTSLLSRLHRVRLPAVGFRTLYLDCSTMPTSDDFLRAPLRGCRPELMASAQLTMSDIIFNQAQLRALTTDRPLVLLLDEADRLVVADRAQDWRIFNALRALTNSGLLHVVLGGERTLREALRDPSGPLFNFANEMLIGRLDPRAAEELITRPLQQLGIDTDDPGAIVRRMYEFSSGHPNIIQRLCRRLVAYLEQHNSRRLTIEVVNQAIADPDFIRKDFLETYFSRASTLEHLCALLMASDTSVSGGQASRMRTLASVHAALQRYDINAMLNQVDGALERLVDLRNILERTRDGYEFAVPAVPLIIAHSRRLEDWIGLRREVFVRAGDIAPEAAPPELQGRIW